MHRRTNGAIMPTASERAPDRRAVYSTPMKGIVLAGGHGTRLRPLTLVTNKHLLPVHGRPMVQYPLECLAVGGIDDAIVVTGMEHLEQFRRVLGDGRALGLRRLSFAGQEGAGGIAHALLCAEEFARGERCCVILGDNLVGRSIRKRAEAFGRQPSGARLLLKEVTDARGLGVARLEGERIASLEEKPEEPAGGLAVTGVYFFDEDVFSICRGLRPSARNELEITDVNRVYLARGDLRWDMLDGWWADAGTFEGLRRAEELVAEHGANRPT
jgi:glucose-1-phosphate thymidylyltransferase